jgi:23S rRNA pseudouridine1911/1915/1917 synthase
MKTDITCAPMCIEPRILRESDCWIILDKPDRWHTVAHRGQKSQRDGVSDSPPDIESWLRERFQWAGGLEEAGIVHRLDFETSGCLLIAKDEANLSRLRLAFRSESSDVKKVYLGIAEPGLPARGEFDLHFTSRHRGSKKITVREAGEARHRGRCAWRVLKRSQLGDLIEVDLLGPGRRHQIRAGLAHLGHPLRGDELYGGRVSAGGMALHAWKLTVDDMETIAPVPGGWPLQPANIDQA